jgi:hypothetical protein
MGFITLILLTALDQYMLFTIVFTVLAAFAHRLSVGFFPFFCWFVVAAFSFLTGLFFSGD